MVFKPLTLQKNRQIEMKANLIKTYLKISIKQQNIHEAFLLNCMQHMLIFLYVNENTFVVCNTKLQKKN